MIRITLKAFVLAYLYGCASVATAAEDVAVWDRWLIADQRSAITVDHSAWQQVLNVYLVTATVDGIYRFDYGAVTQADQVRLQAYIDRLSSIDPRKLKRLEQRAYWINLYNALTVSLVVKAYPVSSIKEVRGGLFRRGPWRDQVISIAGQSLSLDDIEHRILRPIWNDPRIHYAVNCASLGCPNLMPWAYTSANTDELLEQGAREFINHPRGVTLTGRDLQLSSIYDWFAEDFGPTEADLISHLASYAEPELATKLRAYNGNISYAYDWRLNDAR